MPPTPLKRLNDATARPIAHLANAADTADAPWPPERLPVLDGASPIVSAQALAALQGSGAPVVVFDLSFDLADPLAGDALYASAHVAGALRADLDRELSAHGAADAASAGRHPLPSREQVAHWLGRQGVDACTPVVIYDRQGGMFSGRLWWMLRWLGHQPVAVLDGGWAAWLAAGGAVESGWPAQPPAAQRYTPVESAWGLIATAEVAARLGRPGLTLIDARASARYRGEVEPLDPVPGHLPGALNRPFGDNFGPDGRFKPAAQLRAEFDVLLAGRDPTSVVHHCGSGVSAVPNLIAMQLAGLGATPLYAGGYSAWSRTPGLPIAQN